MSNFLEARRQINTPLPQSSLPLSIRKTSNPSRDPTTPPSLADCCKLQSSRVRAPWRQRRRPSPFRLRSTSCSHSSSTPSIPTRRSSSGSSFPTLPM
ncbi:hypothetical protein Zm00014a_044108 [Zea mays]|uniref:Uncharacterized protein n=1 Tax=Zea mays TaxID=4577 RepID=A0A317YE15_MAIZE|nr:hypothetical protein Zm00014a_044108 [Zea mays]